MKTTKCPECSRKLRPCNLARHQKTHEPVAEKRDGYAKIVAKRPIKQHRNHDHRYDGHFPRGEGPFRFRVYRLRAGLLHLIGAAPTPGGYGQAIYEFHREGEFITDDAVGVLDTLPEPGDWVVHPFALGRRADEA
jgi:hypothetical protein